MSRQVDLLLVLIVAGLCGPAGEAMASGASEPGAFEQAKREFDALQSTKQQVGGSDLRNALPQIEGPNAPNHVALPALLPNAKTNETKPARKNTNWLVDALLNTPSKEQNSDNRTQPGQEPEEDKELTPMERLIVEQLREKPAVGSAQTADETRMADELKNSTVNPLEGFMTAWVSPRDHELLLGADTRESGVFPPIERSAQQTTVERSANSWTLGANEVVPISNPYLALNMGEYDRLGRDDSHLDPPAPVSFVPPPLQTRTDSTLENRAFVQERPKESLPPTLTKPEEDARYFPQLKRF